MLKVGHEDMLKVGHEDMLKVGHEDRGKSTAVRMLMDDLGGW